jgi:hypothetical protein
MVDMLDANVLQEDAQHWVRQAACTLCHRHDRALSTAERADLVINPSKELNAGMLPRQPPH